MLRVFNKMLLCAVVLPVDQRKKFLLTGSESSW